MTITHLVLSLASIAVASIGLYFYFKKRIISVEKKLDLMFQLVQEHQRQAQQQAQIILSQKTNNITETTSNQNSKVLVSDESDSESDYGESDSEEISDSESIPEVKNIILNNDNNPLSNIISLTGADATPITIKTIHLGEDNTSDFNSIDNSLDNLIEKKINNEQDTIKIEEITLDSISGDEKELEQQEEDEEEEEEEEEEDLNKLHLPDLKEKAKNLGLSGYSNLRKNPLIQKIKDAMDNTHELGMLD